MNEQFLLKLVEYGVLGLLMLVVIYIVLKGEIIIIYPRQKK